MSSKTNPVEVWRIGPPPEGNWGDPGITYVTTHNLLVQPFTGDDGLRSNQDFSNVRYLIISYDMDIDIRYKDRLKFFNLEQEVSYIQRWDSGVKPHIEIYTSEIQGLTNG